MTGSGRRATILLTGASGEIGAKLLDELAARGHVLVVLSRRAHERRDERITWVRGDLLEPESLSAIRALGADLVVHLAALTHSRDRAAYYRVNAQGTNHLFAALRERPPQHFFYMSTRAVGHEGGAYSDSKAIAETAVRESGIPWTVFRPAEVYGGGSNDPVMSLARALREKKTVPILGDGSYRLAPVAVSDVTGAIVRAVESDPGRMLDRTYVLAGPEEFSYLELVAELERIQGLERRRRIHVPIRVAELAIRGLCALGLGSYVPDQIPRLLLPKSTDSSLARVDLGFDPKPLAEALPPLLRG